MNNLSAIPEKARASQGFTLIEVMVTVVIVGILASVAIPFYGDYVRRGKMQEATSELSNLRVKMEQAFQDNRTYLGYVNGDCVRAGNALAVSRYFTFTCGHAADPGAPDDDDGNTYLITATGVAAQGMNGYVYTINQNNARTSTIAGATVNCWVSKQGESC